MEAGDADAHARETVYFQGEYVVQVSSGGFGFACGKSLVFCYLPTWAAAPPGQGSGRAGVRSGKQVPANERVSGDPARHTHPEPGACREPGERKENTMQSVKESARDTIDRLPDRAGWDEIMYGYFTERKI